MRIDLYDTFGMHFEEFKIRLFFVNVNAYDASAVLKARKKSKDVSQLHVLEERMGELSREERLIVRSAIDRTPLKG